MLFVKKKSGEASTPLAKSAGLFIDRDNRTVEEGGPVIDVESTTIESTPFEQPLNAPVDFGGPSDLPKPRGFAGFRAKKPVGEQPLESQSSPGESSLKNKFSSLKSRFGASPSATKSSASSDIPSKKEKAAVDTKPTKLKKTESSKTPRFSGKADKRVVLMVELDNGRQLFWNVEATKLTQSEDTAVDTVYSFSKDDFRFKADASLNFKQAHDLALQEVGEAVQIVNRSKDLTAVYATRQERALDAKFVIIPAQQALDRLMVERKKVGQALICGFLLKDAAAESSLAVLFHVTPDGESSKPQISVNPDSMEFVIAQFTASRKLDKSATEVVLFDNAEFLGATAGATGYPNEHVWQGIPLRKILFGAAIVSVAASLSMGAWAGLQFQQSLSANSKLTRLSKDVKDKKAELAGLILKDVPNFVRALSMDVPALSTQAQRIWMSEAKLSMLADLASAKYTLTMPLYRAGLVNNKPTALDPITHAMQEKIVNYSAPDGCTRAPIGTTGALNETQITVTCEASNSALSHYRSE